MKMNNYLTAMLSTATPNEIRKVMRAIATTGFDLGISTEITDDTYNFYINNELFIRVYYSIDGTVLNVYGCERNRRLIEDRNTSLFTEEMMGNLSFKMMHDAALRLCGLTGAMFTTSAAMLRFSSMYDATASYIKTLYFTDKEKKLIA